MRDTQGTADLIELVVKQAIAPIVQRVRALEARASGPASLDRQRWCVDKAVAELNICVDEHRMMLAAGLSADSADEPMVAAALAWTRDHSRTIVGDYRRDVIARLTAAGWMDSTPAPAATPVE